MRRGISLLWVHMEAIRQSTWKTKVLDARPILLALVVIGLTCTFDTGVFSQGLKFQSHIFRAFLIRGLGFLLVCGLGYGAKWMAGEIKKGNTLVRRWVQYGGAYFAFNLLLLLICWPGAYRQDEFWIINFARTLDYVYWQHYLTSMFYMVSWTVIPVLSSPIIIECLMASIVVGYLVAFYSTRLPKPRIALLFFIPFLLPPVLDNNLYPMRTTPWTYLILGVIAWLVTLGPQKAVNSPRRLWSLIALLALIGAWRAEGIILLAVFLPFILAYTWKSIGVQSRLALALMPLLGMKVLGLPMADDPGISSHRYEVTAFVGPLAPLIAKYENDPAHKQDIHSLAKVFNFEPFKKKPGGIAFWSGGVKDTFTPEEYLAARSAFLHLAMASPSSVWQERLQLFLESNGFGGFNQVRATNFVFDRDDHDQLDPLIKRKMARWPLFHPINAELRKQIVSLLQMREASGFKELPGSWLLYDGLLGFVAAFAALGVSLRKGNLMIVGACLAMLLCAAGIFLTAPQSFFFYYFYLYIGGPVLLLLAIFERKRRLQMGR
ncbi:MAG: hypothetical protein JSS72_09720 [Armatimonadetes bacterium]|nr:hypothetical protein [Armatimonadota bacterium]